MKLLNMIVFFGFVPTLLLAAPSTTARKQVQFDWNGDGKLDRAEIVESTNNDSVDLLIFFGAGGGRFAEPIIARDFAGSTPMIGDAANVKLNAANSIVVQSSHIGVGRSKYEAETIVGFRNGQMRVIGYNISRWDSLDPDAAFRCDVNFLNKRAIITPPASSRQRIVRHNLQAMPIGNWSLLPDFRGVCPAYE